MLLSGRHSEALDLIMEGNINWGELLRKSDIAQVSPFIYRSVKDKGAVPRDVVKKLETRYLGSLKRNILHMKEIETVLKAFNEGGIDCVPLKGAVASEALFGDAGVYSGSDIDLLVRPQALGPAKKVLEDLGFKQLRPELEEHYLADHYHLPAYVRDEFSIELHWNLTHMYHNSLPLYWWEDIRMSELNGITYFSLSPERYLMYSIFRVYSHGYRPLRFLLLVSGILSAYQKELEWKRILSMARSLKMKRVVRFTIHLARDLLDAPAPEHFIEDGLFMYKGLCKKATEGFFNKDISHSRNMIKYMLLQDNVFLSILKRLFPGMAEIQLRYGIRGSFTKACLYYLLNPVLLILGKKGFGRHA
ncbi:MAG: nucleotidyltransferase family protein [Nitrospirota bacterium]|nr:MAG: nucleotidyltransferase family protein [Nitrospirota bacterium]